MENTVRPRSWITASIYVSFIEGATARDCGKPFLLKIGGEG